MLTLHAYALFWLILTTDIVTIRKFVWVNKHFVWILEFFALLIQKSYFEKKTFRYFIQYPKLYLPFVLLLIIFNALTLFLNLEKLLFQCLSSRFEPLIIINFNDLLFLFLRHSIFFELTIAYQPKFLWTHNILKWLIILKMTLYLLIRAKIANEFQNLQCLNIWYIINNVLQNSNANDSLSW